MSAPWNENRQTADGCNFEEGRYKKQRALMLVLTAGPSGTTRTGGFWMFGFVSFYCKDLTFGANLQMATSGTAVFDVAARISQPQRLLKVIKNTHTALWGWKNVHCENLRDFGEDEWSWCVCVCVVYLGRRMQQDAVWAESEWVEALWCSTKCSAKKTSFLTLMWRFW